MGLKNDIQELKETSAEDYKNYIEKLAILEKEYNDKCSKFDVLIGTINAERLSFRKEIRVLYDFLRAIGGSLNKEKRISVFDFSDEAPAPNQLHKVIPALSDPNFKQNDGWDALYKGMIGVALDHRKNKELYQKFLLEVEERKEEYDKDLSDRTTQIMYMDDAINIAKIYRDIIVTVKDTVAEKIIPELGLIQSFLYADAIREKILDGEKPENIEVFGISEYKDTRQDKHYQFVKNTFDFYRISTTFFKKTVLSDILADRIVTKEEKKKFNDKIREINKQIKLIDDEKVI